MEELGVTATTLDRGELWSGQDRSETTGYEEISAAISVNGRHSILSVSGMRAVPG